MVRSRYKSAESSDRIADETPGCAVVRQPGLLGAAGGAPFREMVRDASEGFLQEKDEQTIGKSVG